MGARILVLTRRGLSKYSVAVDWGYQPDETWGQGTANSWCSGPYTDCSGVLKTPGDLYTGSKQFNFSIYAIDEMRIWWILNSESGYLESCSYDRVRTIRSTFGIFQGEAFVWCN